MIMNITKTKLKMIIFGLFLILSFLLWLLTYFEIVSEKVGTDIVFLITFSFNFAYGFFLMHHGCEHKTQKN